MNEKLEEKFLQQIVESQADVHVFLLSGIKLVGKIGAFDDTCLLLRNTISQIIYKSAISTIVPQTQLNYEQL